MKLNYHSTESGHCRIYYRTGRGALVCFQLESMRAGTFGFLICSPDGEPSHGLESRFYARPPLPPADEVAGDSLLQQFAAFLESGQMPFLDSRTKPVKVDKITGPVFASFENVRRIVRDHQHLRFVWPDEGAFSADGKRFVFNEAHADYKPLCVDAVTANMLCTVRDGIKAESTRAKFVDNLAKGRGHFAKMVQIGWDACK